MQRDLARFEESGAQVLGVSGDTFYAHQAFAAQCEGASFPLLADFYPRGQVASLYGLMQESGFNRRATFLIDKDGIIRYKEVYEPAQLPDNAKLLAELATF